MVSSRPISHRPPQAEQQLEQARGRLRDALGSLSNLDQLLHSVRVGPKALTSVLPDAAASCGVIERAVDELLGVMEPHVPSPQALHALKGFVHPRVQELERELRAASRRPMNAKYRLQLESVVDRSALDLVAARWLIDLLDDALWGPPIRLNLRELVRETARTPVPATESVESTAVTLAPALESLEVSINPRVCMALLGIAIAFIARSHPYSVPHISVVAAESSLVIENARGEVEGLMLVRRRFIPPSLPCLDAATCLTGGSIERAPDASRVTFRWPPQDTT
jgi:hypothetical protein